MKKGALHFLGRKSQSLFDTNVPIKDLDNVELVLGSPAILESGTASVRARPTVKHHTSSDSFQGFAVPTPKVPLLPAVNSPKFNGSVGGDKSSNGSIISVPDLVEGEILVPPPPSVAPPPPPPGTFIPPPPGFMGDLNSLNFDEDLIFQKPPPMAPPKPLSTCSSGSTSSLTGSPPIQVPVHPNFAPPQPPTDKQHKTFKTPPPKPVRLSSISNMDLPPVSPAPPPPNHTPTRSSFNPQNTAKLYNVPQHSILSGFENRDIRPKQKLLLEDSRSGKSVPAPPQVDGKVPSSTKPVSRETQELKESVPISQPSQPSPQAPKKETKPKTVMVQPVVTKPETLSVQPVTIKPEMVSVQPVVTKPVQTPPQKSPLLQKVNSSPSDSTKDTLEEPPSLSGKFSPLIDRKLRNLKNSESSGSRDGPAASPLALLMAAKEREKHRPSHSLSRENSGKKNEPSTSIHPSNSSPNSFHVVPRSSSSSSLTSHDRIEDMLVSAEKPRSFEPVRDPTPTTSPALNRVSAPVTLPVMYDAGPTHNSDPTPQRTGPAEPEVGTEELNVPLLPPPPEFDDMEDFMELPPSIPPPDPPFKHPPPPPSVSLPPPPPALPPSTKPKPPQAPKLPPANSIVKPMAQSQTKPQMVPNHAPTNLSPSQATLLSILQKKMMEINHNKAPVTEADSDSEDWATPLSDVDNKIPVSPKTSPQRKSFPVVNKPPIKPATLDMRELEGKVAKKFSTTSSPKAPLSNGSSKHQYGMTWTVRPGTKQPITPVLK